MINDLICYLKISLVCPSVFCPLRNCGGRNQDATSLAVSLVQKDTKKPEMSYNWTGNSPKMSKNIQQYSKISNSGPKIPYRLRLDSSPHSLLMPFFAQNSKFYKIFNKNAMIYNFKVILDIRIDKYKRVL